MTKKEQIKKKFQWMLTKENSKLQWKILDYLHMS